MQRNRAIDAVKGFAILLVMVGHCIVLNGLDQTDPYVYDGIKSVQMPLFMLVSGVLASCHVRRSGCGTGMRKLGHRAITYLVPFFSWFLLVHIYTHGRAGTLSFSVFAEELKLLLFQTDRGLWFLMTLFVATACTMVAQTVTDMVFIKNESVEREEEKTESLQRRKALLFVLISAVIYFLFFFQSRSGNTCLSPSLMLQYFPFYLSGYVVNGYGRAFLPAWQRTEKGKYRCKVIERSGVAIMLVAFVWMVVTMDLTAPVDGVVTLISQMLASFVGTFSCYIIVYRMAQKYQKKTEKSGFLPLIGMYTLEIYVLHFRFARMLGLSEKGLQLYSASGVMWVFLAFAVMSVFTAIGIVILQRIPLVSFLLFGKRHVPLWKDKDDLQS